MFVVPASVWARSVLDAMLFEAGSIRGLVGVVEVAPIKGGGEVESELAAWSIVTYSFKESCFW